MRIVLALALLLSVSACARGSRTTSQGVAAEEIEPTYLRVENRAFADMTIYVLRSSAARIRLGTVSGASSATFRIPQNLLFGTTALRFMADPIGSSRAPISDEIGVRPGDTVTITIPPQ
jgi:hypothetical protein